MIWYHIQKLFRHFGNESFQARSNYIVTMHGYIIIYTVSVRNSKYQWYSKTHVMLPDNTKNTQYDLQVCVTVVFITLINTLCPKKWGIVNKSSFLQITVGATETLSQWYITYKSGGPVRPTSSAQLPLHHHITNVFLWYGSSVAWRGEYYNVQRLGCIVDRQEIPGGTTPNNNIVAQTVWG
jgi:hypothetical protein